MAACLVKPLRSAVLLGALDAALASRERSDRDREPARPPLASAAPALDLQALADLAVVGGQEFIAEVVREFIDDTEQIIAHLHEALSADDLATFRAQAHALCSSAANVGARGLRELCYPWQTLSAAEMDETGGALLQRLHREWARSRAALLERAG
jgi:two-component system sensor histidine kinase RpfC